MTDSSFILSCRATANPPIVSINGTNSSKKFDNVEFQSNVTEGMFNVTNAKESNRGNYTCTASNGVVTNNLTYNTFIGGMNDRQWLSFKGGAPNNYYSIQECVVITTPYMERQRRHKSM